MLAQQTIPASKDARMAPPMGPAADIRSSLRRILLCSTPSAAAGVSRIPRLALDDVMLADVECQPDNAAVAVIVEHSWE